MPGAPGHPGPLLAWWQKRHTLTALCAASVVISYSDRVNMSVTILDMAEENSWDERTKGVVLSSFFFGYIVTQLAGGFLALRLGGGRTLNAAVFLWSLFTLLTPAAAKTSVGALFVCRVAMGMGEGMGFPCIYTILGACVPEAERARSMGIIQAGVPLGQVAAFFSVPLISARVGWELVFVFFASLGFLWNLLWLGLGVDDRDVGVNLRQDKEKGGDAEGGPAAEAAPKPPLGFFLSNVAVLAVTAAHMCHNWGWWLLMSWLPTFMHAKFGLEKSSLSIIFLPYFVMFLSFPAVGVLADAAYRRGWPKLRIRKLFTAVGMFGPAFGYLLLNSMPTQRAAIALMCFVFLAGTAMGSGALINHLDIAPAHAGILMGISNTAACVPGIIGVPLTGFLLQENAGDWGAVFNLASLVTAAGCVVFLVYARAEPIL